MGAAGTSALVSARARLTKARAELTRELDSLPRLEGDTAMATEGLCMALAFVKMARCDVESLEAATS